MTAPIGCFTSITFGDLPQARVLAHTLRSAHPDWELHAVVVDLPPPGFNAEAALACFDRVVMADRLGIPRFRSWLFKHDRAEARAAVKGAMLADMLSRGFGTVIVLDHDIALFQPLTDTLAAMDHAAIHLTPRQVAPNPAGTAMWDNEGASLRRGAYDTGLIAVRNDAPGQAFAAWWAERLQEACYDDVSNGLFLDQKYCDLVPGLFGPVHIGRDPGCGLASWNLSQRRLRFDAGAAVVNGSPLTAYHFASDPGDTLTERYGAGQIEVFELWHWYRRQVAIHAVNHLPDGYWGYGAFSGGQPIPRAVRLRYRDQPELAASSDDPFDSAGGVLAMAEREGLYPG